MMKFSNLIQTIISLVIIGLLTSYQASAQTCNNNPNVSAGDLDPAPIIDNGNGGMYEFLFKEDLDDIQVSNSSPLRLVITHSGIVPRGGAAAVGGAYAQFFSWSYDAANNTLSGVQTSTIPGGGAGGLIEVDFDLDVTRGGNRCGNGQDRTGFQVNITPSPCMNGINQTTDDSESVFTCYQAPNLPTLVINDVTVNENDGTAAVEVCIQDSNGNNTTSTDNISFNATSSDGTALSTSDYTSINGALSFISAGNSCTTINVNITDDNTGEQTEVFNITLTSLQNAQAGDVQGTVTILDDDGQQANPTISVNDVTVSEGTTASLQICFDNNATRPSATTVTVATSNNTAIAGSDYTTVNTTVTIPANTSCTAVPVPTTSDNVSEPNEIVNVTLSNPSTGADLGDPNGTITITDNTVPPAWSINDVTVSEGSIASLQICLDRVADATYSVQYSTANGSALSGTDYTAVNGSTATVTQGNTCTTINVPTTVDNNNENTENFFVNLTNPTNNSTIADPQGMVTINDNTAAPQLSVQGTTVPEGQTATVRVCTNPTSGQDITVNLTTSNGTALAGQDYNSVNQTVTIPANTSCVNVNIGTITDNNTEPTESFNVNISNPSNGNISVGSAPVNITDSTPQCNASAPTIIIN